jgi:ADP-ribose pyrophosphatase YjhB (NUDIX family)
VLDIQPPDFLFCPFCGQKLQVKTEDKQKRKYCLSCDWTYYPHVAAAVTAVITRKDEVLLVKRAREPYKNTWMFPAGFIDFGEHPFEALKRETKEETGLVVKKAELIEILQSTDDPRSPGHFIFFYKVKTLGKNLKTDKRENQAIAWHKISKPPKIRWRSHQLILKKLQASKV